MQSFESLLVIDIAMLTSFSFHIICRIKFEVSFIRHDVAKVPEGCKSGDTMSVTRVTSTHCHPHKYCNCHKYRTTVPDGKVAGDTFLACESFVLGNKKWFTLPANAPVKLLSQASAPTRSPD